MTKVLQLQRPNVLHLKGICWNEMSGKCMFSVGRSHKKQLLCFHLSIMSIYFLHKEWEGIIAAPHICSRHNMDLLGVLSVNAELTAAVRKM